jgi:hypothetical protein
MCHSSCLRGALLLLFTLQRAEVELKKKAQILFVIQERGESYSVRWVRVRNRDSSSTHSVCH